MAGRASVELSSPEIRILKPAGGVLEVLSLYILRYKVLYGFPEGR